MLVAMEEKITDVQPVNETSKAIKEVDSLSKSEASTPVSVSNKNNLPPITDSQLIRIADFDFNLSRPLDSSGLRSVPLPRKRYGYKGTTYLNTFFQKLKTLETDSSQTVRIAYYGDSMVDGDLIVQDLRSALQGRFGGRGVGFVPIKSESARSRYSVKHKSGGNWDQRTFMKSITDSLDYGISGAVFHAMDSTANVSFKASGIKHSYRLNSPKLFYGKGNDSSQVSFMTEKDSVFNKLDLDQRKPLNITQISRKDLKELNLDCGNATGVPIYGVDFFNEQGITVDGFSHRGNSGLPLSLLDEELIKEFNKELHYDLIVLQFGANVLSTKTKRFNWYANRMKRVVTHLNMIFPDTPILIMGTADKGTKIGETVKTDSTVVRLLRSQQQFASESQSGFLSLFHLMGGIHSMPAWRDHKLANADFTHLSPKGSRKMGRLIFNALMEDYNEYLRKLPKESSNKEQLLATENSSLKDANSLKQEKDTLIQMDSTKTDSNE